MVFGFGLNHTSESSVRAKYTIYLPSFFAAIHYYEVRNGTFTIYRKRVKIWLGGNGHFMPNINDFPLVVFGKWTLAENFNINVCPHLSRFSVNGHFDNVRLIRADKIKTLRRPKSKRCLRADREQITLKA
jgi:hypothetical protein